MRNNKSRVRQNEGCNSSVIRLCRGLRLLPDAAYYMCFSKQLTLALCYQNFW